MTNLRGARLAPGTAVVDASLRLVAAVLSFALLACSGPTSPDRFDPPPPGEVSEVATAIVDLTNAQRRQSGLATLTVNARLTQAAQIQADQMVRAGLLAHVLPNATYPRPEDRLDAVSYDWEVFAENLASGQPTPAAAVTDWMRSSGHRDNILNRSITEMGAGYARDSNGRAYWAQVFGRPSS